MQTLILIRHGQTQKDKSNPERQLTKKGITQIEKNTKIIKTFLKPQSKVLVLHSLTFRTKQTAEIMEDNLKDYNLILKSENLKIINSQSIEKVIREKQQLGIKPAETYLKMGTWKYVENPKELSQRWINKLEKYNMYDTVILVSHEAALEAFLYNQNIYKIIYKNFETYFEYGNFAVLTEN